MDVILDVVKSMCSALVIFLLCFGIIKFFKWLFSKKKETKKKNAKRKIFTTTDGFISGNPRAKKPRRVAVIDQRKDDGAMAIVKIYGAKGKINKPNANKNYIPNLVLSPSKHKSLTKDSIVGRKVLFGVKQKDGTYKAFYSTDFTDTGDKLTRTESRTIEREVQNDTPQYRNTYENTKKNWHKHFKK